MRIELASEIEKTGDKEAIEINENAIKALGLMIQKKWRSHFLSGGPFDFIKKLLRFAGIEKIVKRIFYRS